MTLHIHIVKHSYLKLTTVFICFYVVNNTSLGLTKKGSHATLFQQLFVTTHTHRTVRRDLIVLLPFVLCVGVHR